MGSTDILAFDLTYQPLLSNAQVAKNPDFVIGEGWTLVTRSGTTGRMAYARQAMQGMACSEHVMRVVPDTSKVKPGYLFAYLSSRFGVPLIVSGTYGSVIQSIEPHHISGLVVPRLGCVEDRADQLVQDAAQLLSVGQSNLNEATLLLFNSVGLSDITSSEWNSWGSDVGFETSPSTQSLRALNYNPRFNRLCDRIKQGSWKPLGELCVPGTLKRGGRFGRVDADPEFAYRLVGQKELFWLYPEGRWISRASVPDAVLVEDGCILVAAQGTLGEFEMYCRAEFATGIALANAYSEHILRVLAREDSMERGALFAFMRSESAFRMLRSISFGSKLQDHHHALLPSLPVPFPSAETRKRCHSLVLDAYAKRDRAILLEDEARALVEKAIEEGGR